MRVTNARALIEQGERLGAILHTALREATQLVTTLQKELDIHDADTATHRVNLRSAQGAENDIGCDGDLPREKHNRATEISDSAVARYDSPIA